MKTVIISGKQGSGKTTLAKNIAQAWSKYKGNKSVLINFADPLYDMHNFIIGYLEHHGIKRDIKKDGPLLQLLGTEWGRKTVSEDIWVKLLGAKMAEVSHPSRNLDQNLLFIVADCRFRNEFDAFKGGALMVRLECPKLVRRTRCEMWRDNDEHLSEIDLDEYSANGAFDLKINTEKIDIEGATSLVMARLL